MTAEADPGRDVDPGVAPVVDAVQALPGLFRLVRRAGSLDGTLPMRAVQHCTPVLLGTAAGFQVTLEHPIALRRGRTGVVVTLGRPGADRMPGEVASALAGLVDRGWLAREGPWPRAFRDGAFALRGDRLLVWTGWLVRPARGTALLVSGAYNRRSHVGVREHLVRDAERFTPLVLEIDLADLPARPVWLEGEVGCATPLVPAVRFAVLPLAAAPEAGEFVRRFYDASYFAEKRNGPTKRYRRLHATLASDAPPRAACRLAYAGPAVHRVRGRWRCAGPEGWSTWAGSGNQVLEQAIVRCEDGLEATWDGHAMTGVRMHGVASRRRFSRVWRRVYGLEAEHALEAFRDGFVRHPLDEPYLGILPWVFVSTPPGWSSIADGFHGRFYDGMRGVVDTDAFGMVSTVYRFHQPGRIRLPRAAPLFRVLPVPRALFRRPLRQLDAEAGPQGPDPCGAAIAPHAAVHPEERRGS
jgi:hypothetical protein